MSELNFWLLKPLENGSNLISEEKLLTISFSFTSESFGISTNFFEKNHENEKHSYNWKYALIRKKKNVPT